MILAPFIYEACVKLKELFFWQTYFNKFDYKLIKFVSNLCYYSLYCHKSMKTKFKYFSY